MATLARTAQRTTVTLPQAARVSRIPRTLLAAIALLLAATVGLLQVLQTSHAATAGYELRTLESERSALSAQVRLLEAEIASTAAEGKTREQAVQRLGMVPAKETVHITVDTPAPAQPALPNRYVVRPQATEPPPLAWWEQFLQYVPGFR
jgi:cell division protein FtsB